MAPARLIKLKGAFNVRDLGGYETRDGRRTQWRRFIRADCLDKINVDELASLIDGGLKTVIDLRNARENGEQPSAYRQSTSSPRFLNVDLIGDPLLVTDQSQWTQPRRPPQRYLALYSGWLDDRQESIRTVLSTLAASDALPALFNCHAGKDRTGVIAARAGELQGNTRRRLHSGRFQRRGFCCREHGIDPAVPQSQLR